MTSDPIDTTGASLLVVALGYFYPANPVTLTDNKGNTWIALTRREGDSGRASRIYYAINPVVGSGHTFTTAGLSTYVGLIALAVSVADTTSPFDVENGASGSSGTSLAAGSVSPSENGELLVTALTLEDGMTSVAVDNSFAIQAQIPSVGGVNLGCALATKIQTSAMGENPAWSWSGSFQSEASIATFKAGSGSAKPWWTYVQSMMGSLGGNSNV